MNHLYLKKFQIGIWLADIDKNKINKNITFNRNIKEFKIFYKYKFKEISEDSYPINKNELLVIKIKETTIVLVRQLFLCLFIIFSIGKWWNL